MSGQPSTGRFFGHGFRASSGSSSPLSVARRGTETMTR
jgi:hypothetical protein